MKPFEETPIMTELARTQATLERVLARQDHLQATLDSLISDVAEIVATALRTQIDALTAEIATLRKG
jgi:cytochrome c556